MGYCTQVCALGVALALAACGKTTENVGAPLKVAAAASLADAFTEVIRAYEARTGQKVTLSSGSSGKLAAQIAEGAPHDVFASAHPTYVDELIANGSAVAATKTVYAYGRLAMWTSSAKTHPIGLAGLTAPRYTKIALAKPEHAPYGLAAKQALVSTGVWQSVADRIVYGTNVAQALQFGESGNADVALTALGLVLSGAGHYSLVDDTHHDPLGQTVVLLTRSRKTTSSRTFIAFLQGPEGRGILSRFGLMQRGRQ